MLTLSFSGNVSHVSNVAHGPFVSKYDCFNDIGLCFQFADAQFDEECSDTKPCDKSENLVCSSDRMRCVCNNLYYNKNKTCYLRMC